MPEEKFLSWGRELWWWYATRFGKKHLAKWRFEIMILYFEKTNICENDSIQDTG